MKSEFKIMRRSIFEFFGNYKYSRPALHNLDRKLEKYLNFENGFFIEVGANDGYEQSNTYLLEKMLGWQGILIEGIPELYENCKRIRTKSSVYNYALVSPNFSEHWIEMHYANLMSVVTGSLKNQRFQEEHIQEGLTLQKIEQSYTVKVPTRTLASILDEFKNLPPIDFFSLDVEGYELNVLLGLNLEKYQPKYILVEARYFEEVNSLLEPFYVLVEKFSHHDFFYKLKK